MIAVKNVCEIGGGLMVRDRSLFIVGGWEGHYIWGGGRVTIFLAPFWGGPLFLKLYLGTGCDFFSLNLYKVSQMIFISSFS